MNAIRNAIAIRLFSFAAHLIDLTERLLVVPIEPETLAQKQAIEEAAAEGLARRLATAE